MTSRAHEVSGEVKQSPGSPGELRSKLSPSHTQPIQDASLSLMQPAVNEEWRRLEAAARASQGISEVTSRG